MRIACLLLLALVSASPGGGTGPRKDTSNLVCPGCPACDCLAQRDVQDAVADAMVMAIDAAQELRRAMPPDCILAPGRAAALQRAFPGATVCSDSGPCGAYPLRNLALPPDLEYQDESIRQRRQLEKQLIEQRPRHEPARSCTEMYGVDVKAVYAHALDAIFHLPSRPLWWLYPSQAKIEGWDSTGCTATLHISAINVTAWLQHANNYTQPFIAGMY